MRRPDARRHAGTRRRGVHAVLLVLLLAACAPRGAGANWADATWARLSLRERIAQMIVADAAAAAASPDGVGGLLVRGGAAASQAEALARRQRAAAIPLLVAAPLDEGAGARLTGATAFPGLAAAARAAEPPAELRRIGRVAGREARAIGIHLALLQAPLPAEPAAAGAWEYVAGLRESGLLVAVHAFAVPEETEGGRRTSPLFYDRAWLETGELAALRQAVAAGVEAVLLAPVALPALAGDTLPLPFAAASGAELLRRDLGFAGLVAADLSADGALVRTYGATEAAVRAVAGGVELLLGVAEPAAAVEAVAAAVEAGRLPRDPIDRASRRILRVKQRLGLHHRPAPAPQRLPRALERRDARQLAEGWAEWRARHAAGPASVAAPALRVGRAADAGMSEAALARVDAIIDGAIAEGLIPGAALAVGRRGVLVRLAGYGRLSREPDAPAVEPGRTLYDLASLTKVVGTTAAVMALIDDGRLELDAPVQRYLPEFAGADREQVTIRRLLAHTGGLPAGLALHGRADSPQDALRRVIDAPLVLDPGAVALYSDLGFIVLGEVVARAAGEPLDRFLARRIFRPLGMTSTMFLPPLALRPWTAPTAQPNPEEFELQGIVHDGTAFRLGGVAGHAGLFSTARDLAVFAQTMLNGGAYDGRRVFQPQTVAAFRQRQPRAQERALGWDTPAPESSAGSYFSAASFGHTGFTGTSLWIDPETELFVVLLTNRTYDRTSNHRMLQFRQRVHDAVARAIVDQPPRKRPGAVDVVTPPAARPTARARR